MEAVSLIKENCNGIMKGQWKSAITFFKSGDSVASPTASLEAILGSFMIE